jgi:outer membrane protein assembly factor BamB
VKLAKRINIVTILDAKDGKVEYEGGRVPKATTFMASPVAYEGKILLTSEEGDTFVLKAGPKHEVLRTNALGEPVYASPAIADGKIFIALEVKEAGGTCAVEFNAEGVG